MDDFDKAFNRTQRVALLGFCISSVAGLATLAFIAWVVVKLLAHFGVI